MFEPLTDVKAGDVLVREIGYGYKSYSLETVERTTRTQIITKHERFRVSDGMLIGASGYGSVRLYVPSESEVERIKAEAAASKIADRISRMRPAEIVTALGIEGVHQLRKQLTPEGTDK